LQKGESKMKKKLSETITLKEMEGYTDISDLIREINMNLGEDKDEVDWDDILQLCHKYSSTFGGFNIFPQQLKDYNSFLDLRSNILDAMSGDAPLIVRKCRDCGETYFIYKSEKEFYSDKGLSLPKRCKSCRCKKKRIDVVSA
jgi:hypothetical protein